MIVRATRCESDTAIAHHRGRYAVPGRRCKTIVPCGLAVVMRMDVHKSRRDQMPLGIDFFFRRAGDPADFRNLAVRYAHVAVKQVSPGTVRNRAATDDEPVRDAEIDDSEEGEKKNS